LKCVDMLEDAAMLAKATVELAAEVAGGKIFVQATYNLEIGGFGAVVAYDQVSKIEAAMDAGIPMPALTAASRAALLIKPLKDAKDAALGACEADLVAAKAALVAVTNAGAEPVPAAAVVATVAPPVAARRPIARRDYAAMAGGAQSAADKEAAAAAKVEKAKATEVVKTAALAVEKEKAAGAEWVAKMGPLSEAEFEAYGRAVVQPGYDYFTKLFRLPNGEMWAAKMAYRGATVFDALKLRTMDVTTGSLLVDNLVHFNFPEFTGDFRAHLKAELPLLLQHARRDFNWSAVPGAAEYDATLAHRLKLKETQDRRRRRRRRLVVLVGTVGGRGRGLGRGVGADRGGGLRVEARPS